MKTNVCKLMACWICVVFLNNLYAMSQKEILEKYWFPRSPVRNTGRAFFLCSTYQKAFTEADLLNDKTFESEKNKEEYLRLLAVQSAVNLNLKEDKIENVIQKLWYDGSNTRKEYLSLKEEDIINSLLEKPLSFLDTLRFNTIVSDGRKSIQFSKVDIPGNRIPNRVYLTNKTFFPPFQDFGYIESALADQSLSLFSEMLDKGWITLNSKTEEEIISIDMEMPRSMSRFQQRVDMSKGNTIIYKAQWIKGYLVHEQICEKLIQLNSGQWYPQRIQTNYYVCLKDENFLSYSETYELLDISFIGFNENIDSKLFAMDIPDNSYVIDSRDATKIQSYVKSSEVENDPNEKQ